MKLTKRHLIILAISTVALIVILSFFKNWNSDKLMLACVTTVFLCGILNEFTVYKEKFEYKDISVTEINNGIKILFPNNITFTETRKYLLSFDTLFHLQTPKQQFFAKSTIGNKYKFDIYEDLEERKYVITFDLTRQFPLVDRNEPKKVIWSSYTYNDRHFAKRRYLTWRKDSKPVIHLKYISYTNPPKLGLFGAIQNNELDLFLAILSIQIIPDLKNAV